MTAMRLHRYPSPSGGIALGKMGVGATMMKQGATASDYVQSGLVAMWDGIENAGWGQHDGSATSWKNLVGSFDMPLPTGSSFVADGLATFRENGSQVVSSSDTPDNPIFTAYDSGTITIEILYNKPTATPNSSVGYKNTLCSFFILGLSACHVATYSTDTVGFCPNPETSSDNVSLKGTVASNVGKHQLTVRQASGDAYINFDGVLVKSASGLVPSTRGSGHGIRFNCDYYSDMGLTGTYHCIRFYSRALTAAEIAANYAIDKERFNLP